eukprot:TRINITY_DN62_c0_g1_i2.p1 TRINITY_DN62_c0_g1~~TRINITY_DN62_c0_g1_i2.p1  ORF type:complete len:294 (+),score=108.00 TRINITY_DN62_c0_g1_i2:77-958(+)
MMSQTLFAAMWVSCVVAANDVAPLDGDAPVEVPPPPPFTVRVCTVTADCTWAGDAGATCTADGQCKCTTYTGALCHKDANGNVAKAELRMNAVATMAEATCDRPGIAALVALTIADVEKTVAKNTVAVASCGSVTLVADTELPTQTLAAAIQTLASTIRDSVVAKESLTAISATSTLEVIVRAAAPETSGAVCTPNAVNTVESYDGRCIVLECASGYVATVETVNQKDHGTCQATADRGGDSDDDLSGGAIAGIVIGCLVFVVVVGAIAFFALKPRIGYGTGDENEPTTDTAV